MKRVLGSISALSLGFVIAACASEADPGDKDNDTAGTAGMVSTSGAAGTGTAGSPSGGKSGGSSGAGGTGQAGTGGSQSGSTGGGQSGSTGGGGSPAAGTGNTTGGTSGSGVGGGDSGSGGTGGTPAAGSGGDGAGGSTGGSGGEPAAGTGGAGGSGGTSPTTREEPLVITSDQTGGYWKTATAMEVTSGGDITVNDNAAQTWTGFGGTFNEKGWEALSSLNETDRATAIKLLFDYADGANFIYGRIPIGASDYASNRYTLNDTAGDTAMNSFSIDRDKMKLIPYIQAALAVKPDIKFWGSPWTPPPWMKDNNNYDKGNMKDDATILTAYALYLAKFVEEYGKVGIAVTSIHPQNEPGFVQDYPSCSWSGGLMAKFIGQYLGPTFRDRNVPAEIFIGTMSNSTADATVLNTVMGNSTAKPFIKGHGLQWGMIDVYGSLSLDRNLPIWQTEHKCGNYPWMGGNASKAPNDFAYGVESWGLIRDWIKKGVNSYSAWNMVLDTVGRSLDTVRPWAQNALLAVDTQARRLIPTPAYYVFRHVSQYTDPGAKLVGTNQNDALAFKNPDGSYMVAIYNSGGAKQMTVAAGSKHVQFMMPGNGWATVNIQP